VSDELRELYQEVILDHSKNPRNFREIAEPTHQAKGHNPLCGDRLTLFLRVDEKTGEIRDVAFKGAGCAISTASASMMTEALKGKTEEEADAIFRAFHELVTGQSSDGGGAGGSERLGKLAVFGGVREFPVRVKCATLAWHTFKSAIEHETEAASTE
jgi:nitrogen fixation NifU-like protein